MGIDLASSPADGAVRVLDIFLEWNKSHFSSMLPAPLIRINPRLKASAGRFIPGGKRLGMRLPATIEIASYLFSIENSEHHLRDTIGHEMIHYWLWVRRKPYGHTSEFNCKREQMGVSRYNPVPKLRPVRFVYGCPGCQKQIPARRRFAKNVACADCCDRESQGRYDARFVLKCLAESGDCGEMLSLDEKLWRD